MWKRLKKKLCLKNSLLLLFNIEKIPFSFYLCTPAVPVVFLNFVTILYTSSDFVGRALFKSIEYIFFVLCGRWQVFTL